jgi:HrpA-like RNA helicase
MPKRDIDSFDRSGGGNGDPSQGISKAPKRKIDLGGDRRDNNSNAADSGPSQESAFSPWTGRPFSSRYYSILETRRKLPVYLFKDKLMDVVTANQVVIVEGAYYEHHGNE